MQMSKKKQHNLTETRFAAQDWYFCVENGDVDADIVEQKEQKLRLAGIETRTPTIF
mgnify:FL=1